MVRSIFTICLFFVMVGCASKQSFELAQYDRYQNPQYPSVSFTLNDGYVASDSGCNQHGCYSYRDNNDFFLISALRNTGLFERVDINNAYSEYTFDIKFYDTFKGSDGAEFSKVMLGAATLFLVPTVSDKKVHFSVSLRHKNEIIKKYLYEDEYTETSSLFIDPQSGSKNAVEYFVSLLMRDLQKDEIFTRGLPNKASP
ncbi:hypothetical protein Q8A57_10730 [Porticoccus litoralis]|uniref:Lipoprotein n=1 Tax=Porticoccus litoralis TaxID=434086 RepID=A0AAW8B5V2_9GAMM|nr:hypothetical protein [Porticoccus litoralis]MDP1521444.1 hypothetical protein [Porticoccus litoralis]